jgi:hypothetical protein
MLNLVQPVPFDCQTIKNPPGPGVKTAQMIVKICKKRHAFVYFFYQNAKCLLDALADPRVVYLYLLTERRYFFEGKPQLFRGSACSPIAYQLR